MFVPFVKTAAFRDRESLDMLADLLPRGQWVSLDGRRGRIVGSLDGVAWVHWQDMGRTADDFARSCRAYRNAVTMAARKPAKRVSILGRMVAAWVRHFAPVKDETCGYSLETGRR